MKMITSKMITMFTKIKFKFFYKIMKDNRTTLMIKNIPNKYTNKLLGDKINFFFKDKYDFFYLPMDFKVLILLKEKM